MLKVIKLIKVKINLMKNQKKHSKICKIKANW